MQFAQTLFQLPEMFRGSLYNSLYTNDPSDDVILPKILKTDMHIENLGDVLQVLDTCCYLGCDVPEALYDSVVSSYETLLPQLEEYKNGLIYSQYAHCIFMPEVNTIENYLRFCVRNFAVYTEPYVSLHAIMNTDSVVLMKYFQKRYDYRVITCGRVSHESVLEEACITGAYNILEYLKDEYTKSGVKYRILEDADFAKGMYLMAACIQENLTMFIFLREFLGLPWNYEILHGLMRQNNIYFPKNNKISNTECFRYAVENGCPFDSETMRAAVSRGLIEEIKILRKAGEKFDPIYTLLACEKDNVLILKYLHVNGCPLHSNAFNIATLRQSFQCLKYYRDFIEPGLLN